MCAFVRGNNNKWYVLCVDTVGTDGNNRSGVRFCVGVFAGIAVGGSIGQRGGFTSKAFFFGRHDGNNIYSTRRWWFFFFYKYIIIHVTFQTVVSGPGEVIDKLHYHNAVWCSGRAISFPATRTSFF